MWGTPSFFVGKSNIYHQLVGVLKGVDYPFHSKITTSTNRRSNAIENKSMILEIISLPLRCDLGKLHSTQSKFDSDVGQGNVGIL